jgi:hypothetical protein
LFHCLFGKPCFTPKICGARAGWDHLGYFQCLQIIGEHPSRIGCGVHLPRQHQESLLEVQSCACRRGLDQLPLEPNAQKVNFRDFSFPKASFVIVDDLGEIVGVFLVQTCQGLDSSCTPIALPNAEGNLPPIKLKLQPPTFEALICNIDSASALPGDFHQLLALPISLRVFAEG